MSDFSDKDRERIVRIEEAVLRVENNHKGRLKDHEKRIRGLEKKQTWLFGAGAAIATVFAVAVESLRFFKH